MLYFEKWNRNVSLLLGKTGSSRKQHYLFFFPWKQTQYVEDGLGWLHRIKGLLHWCWCSRSILFIICRIWNIYMKVETIFTMSLVCAEIGIDRNLLQKPPGHVSEQHALCLPPRLRGGWTRWPPQTTSPVGYAWYSDSAKREGMPHAAGTAALWWASDCLHLSDGLDLPELGIAKTIEQVKRRNKWRKKNGRPHASLASSVGKAPTILLLPCLSPPFPSHTAVGMPLHSYLLSSLLPSLSCLWPGEAANLLLVENSIGWLL